MICLSALLGLGFVLKKVEKLFDIQRLKERSGCVLVPELNAIGINSLYYIGTSVVFGARYLKTFFSVKTSLLVLGVHLLFSILKSLSRPAKKR